MKKLNVCDTFGGETGPGPLGAPGPRYGVRVVNVYSMIAFISLRFLRFLKSVPEV